MEDPDDITLEVCTVRLQETADELMSAGADHGTVLKALVDVIAQVADEDRIAAQVVLEAVAVLLNVKIIEAGARSNILEVKGFVAEMQKRKSKPEPKSRKSKPKRPPRKK